MTETTLGFWFLGGLIIIVIDCLFLTNLIPRGPKSPPAPSNAVCLIDPFWAIYLAQLIEHPILRIPNSLFTFGVFFPDKSFRLISKYTKNDNITRYIKKKRKNTLQHLKLGILKFGIRKIGCSMSWTRWYIHKKLSRSTSLKGLNFWCTHDSKRVDHRS